MPTRPRQIIAVGGGGNRDTDPDRRLDTYMLRATGVRSPRVCFLPTATGDRRDYLDRFYTAMATQRCKPTHVSFFERTPDLRATLLAQDLIYVGGGNTKSMLAVWREWGVPDLLRRAWRAGVVLAGVSAGAICWFDRSVTDSWAASLAPLDGLGFLPGTCCPHYDGEPERRPALHAFVRDGRVPSAIAIDDGAAAHFVGRELHAVVSCRPEGGAYRVERSRAGVIETPLPVLRLGRNGRPRLRRRQAADSRETRRALALPG